MHSNVAQSAQSTIDASGLDRAAAGFLAVPMAHVCKCEVVTLEGTAKHLIFSSHMA